MKRLTIGTVMVVWFVAFIGLAALNMQSTATARAQELPVLMVERPQQQNNAQWTISDDMFESSYPNGFSFSIKAASSGGEIVSARAEWYHRPNTRPNEPLTVRRAEGEIDPDTGIISASWVPTGTATQLPPWVAVEYHWKFRDAAGNEYETEPTIAEYEDTSRTWVRTESEDVLVFSSDLPNDIGQMVVDAMDAQREKYEAGWGKLLPYRPRVILFGDFDAWLEWQTGYQDTTGLGVFAVGFTSDDWGGTVQVMFGSEEELAYSTVLHEVEHLYQQEFLASRDVWTPGWFIEGDATYYQMEDMYYATAYVDNVIREGRLPALLSGEGPTTGGENALDGYYIGYTFFVWMEEQFGIEAHRQWMELLAQDVPFFEALETVTGRTTVELERGWRESIGASGDAPTLIPTWTPAFPVVITPPPGG